MKQSVFGEQTELTVVDLKKNSSLNMLKGTWQQGGFSGVFAEICSA